MKNGEEGAGSAGASPGPAAQEEVALEARRVIYDMFKRRHCFDPASDVHELIEDLRSAGYDIVPMAERSGAPSPSEGEGPSNPYLGMTGLEIQREVNRRQTAQVEKLAELPPPLPGEGRP